MPGPDGEEIEKSVAAELSKQVIDWCVDIGVEMSQIEERAGQLIKSRDEKLQAEMEDLRLMGKERWDQATEDQKKAWRICKQENFGRTRIRLKFSSPESRIQMDPTIISCLPYLLGWRQYNRFWRKSTILRPYERQA
jgi:hypothetical protein